MSLVVSCKGFLCFVLAGFSGCFGLKSSARCKREGVFNKVPSFASRRSECKGLWDAFDADFSFLPSLLSPRAVNGMLAVRFDCWFLLLAVGFK